MSESESFSRASTIDLFLSACKHQDLPDVVLSDQKFQQLFSRRAFIEVALRVEDLMRGNSDGYEGHIGILYGLGKNISKAKAWLKRGDAKNDVICVYSLGCILGREGRYEEAESYMQRAANAGL